MTDSKVEAAKQLLANRTPPREVASNLGVSIATLYRWVPATARSAH
jgi:Trp operon repressor